MDFNKFIVGTRGVVSERFKTLTDPQPEATTRPIKKGQLFIAENGGVYKRKLDGSNKEVMLPRHLPAQSAKHSADDREKQKRLVRLRMMVQMRDLAADIIESLRNEKAGVTVSPARASSVLQKELREVYEKFVWGFKAIKHYELAATGELNDEGYREMKQVRPNMKKFNKDPEAYLFDVLEIFDESTGESRPGPIFDPILNLEILLGAEEFRSRVQAEEPAPLPV